MFDIIFKDKGDNGLVFFYYYCKMLKDVKGCYILSELIGFF